MINREVSAIVDRTVRASAIRDQIALSQCHQVPLQGVTTMWCGQCGGTVPAADLDHETHAPLRGIGGAS
jgi:hypothetical protein